MHVGILTSDTERIEINLMAFGDHMLMNSGIRPLILFFQSRINSMSHVEIGSGSESQFKKRPKTTKNRNQVHAHTIDRAGERGPGFLCMFLFLKI
jgi:hypothetical protein